MTRPQRHVPRLALTKPEAAESLGMSIDSFDRYVGPEVPVIRHGRLRLYPVRELERWVERSAELTVEIQA